VDHNISDEWRATRARIKTENAARRDRVLAHPDLAAQLADALGLSDPARWSGWIPPKTLAEDVCPGCRAGECRPEGHRARINSTYPRRTVVDIAAEALRRDTQPALDEIDEATR
jgi:hypothetical protein